MRRVRVAQAARNDLAEIGDYTLERWGQAQCERYLLALDRRIRWLGRNSDRGQSVDHLWPGYFRIREGKHAIFYRVAGDTVEVMRILHERMLPQHHLR